MGTTRKMFQFAAVYLRRHDVDEFAACAARIRGMVLPSLCIHIRRSEATDRCDGAFRNAHEGAASGKPMILRAPTS